MHERTSWDLMIHHLSGNETVKEKELFSEWLKHSQRNKDYFDQFKSLWENTGIEKEKFKYNVREPFMAKFSAHRIRRFILEQALGNFVGFVIGIWVVSTFTHKVVERRNINNLFGIAGRKQIVVDDVPSWMQHLIAILAGFIVLELIGYFFKERIYLLFWVWMKKKFKSVLFSLNQIH